MLRRQSTRAQSPHVVLQRVPKERSNPRQQRCPAVDRVGTQQGGLEPHAWRAPTATECSPQRNWGVRSRARGGRRRAHARSRASRRVRSGARGRGRYASPGGMLPPESQKPSIRVGFYCRGPLMKASSCGIPRSSPLPLTNPTTVADSHQALTASGTESQLSPAPLPSCWPCRATASFNGPACLLTRRLRLHLWGVSDPGAAVLS